MDHQKIMCPPFDKQTAYELSAWIAHRLRNANTPMTMHIDILLERQRNGWNIERRDLLILAGAVALSNTAVEVVIATILNSGQEASGEGH